MSRLDAVTPVEAEALAGVVPEGGEALLLPVAAPASTGGHLRANGCARNTNRGIRRRARTRGASGPEKGAGKRTGVAGIEASRRRNG